MTIAPSTNGLRKVNGQFGEGNKYGRGNPHARKVAQLRTAMIESVTTEDMQAIVMALVTQAIVMALVTQAKAGDIASIKFLLPYLVGAAPKPINPDEIEIDEMKLEARLVQEKSQEKRRRAFTIPALQD